MGSIGKVDTDEDNNAAADGMSTTSESDFNFCSRRMFDVKAKRMQQFYEQRLFCDVTLIVSEKHFPAHRIVLAASSDYFRALFQSNMLESSSVNIELHDMDPNVIEAIIAYCYHGEILLTESRVERLLDAASLLQLSELVEACSDFLKQRLHPSNSLGIRSFAESHGCVCLYNAAENYVFRNFMEVMNQQEFLLLSAEDVFHLLSSDDVNVSSESVIFEAILVWLNRDYAERKKHFHKLLSTVRMPLLPPQYIADQIECHPLLKEDQECYEYVLEAYRYHLLPEYRHFLHMTARARPRKSTVGLLYLMGGMDSNKGALAIESYNFLKDQWEIVCSMNRRRLQFGMARVGQIIYIIGGRDGLKTLALVACWDYRNDGWSNGAPMNNARHGVSVVVMNDIIYAIGGHDSWSYLASAERFDGRVWTPIADMNCARMSCGVAVLDGRIYAVGGRDASSVHKSVECYNPASNRWTFCAEMNRRRAGVGVGVLNGCVYAVGGMDTPENNYSAKRHASVERYDPAVNQWTLIADLSSGRDGIAVCALGSYLFAIGGFNGSTYEDRVEYYDEGEDEWTEVKSLCVGRAGACVAVIPSEGQNANF